MTAITSSITTLDTLDTLRECKSFQSLQTLFNGLMSVRLAVAVIANGRIFVKTDIGTFHQNTYFEKNSIVVKIGMNIGNFT
jgi:hypothetical protein